ncbi:YpjP family protein [Bacillus norwichensis]|uniref:YpjP family protein n=1 Tax=Bacillus norwichensis TaxID=2762217 RepID=A0ABR8VRR1_9BACI|nr:YpjP family protein [Bacillus norwichensis]MBD8007101.1 YpjP family protein [Bacillus norwichensis]
MKLWIRKVFVFLIALLTLGFYIPSIEQEAGVKEESEVLTSFETLGDSEAEAADRFGISEEKQALLLTSLAREQAMAKLGPRILKQVEDEFIEGILPGMEEVLSSLLIEAGSHETAHFQITDQPSSGYGERIFHVYDVRNEKDVARFHVRRDKRPLEGYWFNFHYHLSKDNFEKHHEIGEIYWSKNTPPKWMA